ncbi:hypothetical protein PG997_009755 [Apiospora hydei]|uniref:Heterokaryon incompatibility domain-containing protein n=1 Tax=Apiospora hydei TaxID=1337664 RepID=A0ABR1VV49_9PEZI
MARDAAAVSQNNDDGPGDATRTSQNPGRLIDVFPEGVNHCWGGTLTKDLKTTSANLRSRFRGIPHEILPPSFRDAVTITRALGVRYLWIDALCIIQDSKEDWAAESVKMASIYGNAPYSDEEDEEEDPLASAGDSVSKFTEITTVLSTGDESTLLIYRPPPDLERPAALEGSILSTRGWTFQENILSPRTIHFTATQMVWESRGAFTTEDGLPFVRAFGEDEQVRSIMAGEAYGRDDLFQIWHTWLVERNYSRRRFTKYQDRGIAVAGVARQLAAHTGARYLAGLWGHRLPTDLGWFRTESAELDPKSRGKSPRHPTWSWTSYDFPVAWKPAVPEIPAIRPDEVDDATKVFRSGIRMVDSMITHDVQLECLDGSDNPFGPITSGKLHITCDKGQCDLVRATPWGGPCIVLPSSGGSPLAAECEAIMDYDDSPGPLEYVILGTMQSVVARDGIEVTLLLVKPSPDFTPGAQQPPVYTRVGVAHARGYQNEIAETWCSQAEEVNIILE